MRDPADDLSLVRRVQAGEKAALAELYDRHAALMYGTAVRILRSEPEAEDALQDAWIQVWSRSATFEPKRGSVASSGVPRAMQSAGPRLEV